VDRSKDYDSITDDYVRFLTEELIPDRIATKYAIVDDPNGWAIGGHSSGGSASFTAGWQKPDKFRKILTNSGSFVNLQGDMSAGNYPMLVPAQTQPSRFAWRSPARTMIYPVGEWPTTPWPLRSTKRATPIIT
jgi:enterochelin esterase family protein